MSRRIIASLAAAGVAILASCSQDKSPNALLPTEASLVRTTPPPSCSFSTINADAKNYFFPSTGSTKDAVFAKIDAMQNDYNTKGGKTGATSAGFDVLRRLGEAVGTTAAVGTATQGSQFANDVLLCMDVNGFTYAASQFTSALDPATGLFAVRSSSVDDAAAVVAQSVRFGAEPTGDHWPLDDSPSGKALFYASSVGAAVFKTDTKETSIGTAFDLKTLPSPLTFDPVIRVGVCDLSANGRILHKHTANSATTIVVLPPDDPTFCSITFEASANAPSSMFAFAAQHVASWLLPQPAYATSRSMMPTTLLKGGGTVGGLSEIGPINAPDTLILQRIPNAKVSAAGLSVDDDPETNQFVKGGISVTALTKSGKNPLAGVQIELTVVGNKGSFAADGGIATTDASGVARFPNFFIDKAGGYTVTAKASDSEGFTPNFVATSNLFNISGQ
jgi:hypothetical protein